MVIVFACKEQVGGTFLNWSFHWLSGHKNYWNEKKKGWLELPGNPLTDRNAHFFKKNHPLNFENWKLMIDHFCTYDHLGKDYALYGSSGMNNQFEYKSCISYVLNKKIKLIFLGCDYPIYRLLQRGPDIENQRGPDPSLNHAVEERNIAILKKIKQYFNSVQNLESLISTPGKARNFLSLSMKNLRHDSNLKLTENFFKNENFLWINLRDLLKDGKECLAFMFKFLDRKIDGARMEHWLAVHAEWRKFLLPTLNFYDDLTRILYSIVHGDSLSLKEYRLDIFTEAIILHELMLRYRDRLLVTHLDHFPDNTKELTGYLLKKNNHEIIFP